MTTSGKKNADAAVRAAWNRAGASVYLKTPKNSPGKKANVKVGSHQITSGSFFHKRLFEAILTK